MADRNGQTLEALRQRRQKLKLQRRSKEAERERLSYPETAEEYRANQERLYEIECEVETIDGHLDDLAKDLELLSTRSAIRAAERHERADSLVRYAFLTGASASMILVAYFFRSSSLAAIPLLGIVLLAILWPVFEKFRNLSHFTADFHHGRLNVSAATTETDEFFHNQAQLARKKVELELVRVERQIEEAKTGKAAAIRQVDQEGSQDRGPLSLGPPGEPDINRSRPREPEE